MPLIDWTFWLKSEPFCGLTVNFNFTCPLCHKTLNVDIDGHGPRGLWELHLFVRRWKVMYTTNRGWQFFRNFWND